MKRVFILLASIFAISAHAATDDWATQLENYRQQVQSYSNSQLYGDQLLNMTGAVVGCAGSVAVTAASFVADTLPVTGPAAEYIASKTNENYQSYETLISWETLVNAGRTVGGGATLATYESFEFIFYWLSGDTEKSFAQLKEMYASSYATLDALFSKESACVMNIARVAVVKSEWRRRSGLSPVAPFTPMNLH